MAKDRDSITIQLVGGLGNQLFGYFAGRFLSKKLNVDLKLDMSEFDLGITAHGSDIRSFAIREPIVFRESEKRFHVIVANNFLNFVATRIPRTRLIVENLTSIHTSQEIGLDPRMDFVKPGMFVRGYFQSFEYVSNVISNGEESLPGLKDPSSWYQDQKKLALSTQPIMLHARRGDYAKKENADFGMLSVEYYKGAAQTLRRALGDDREIWVFSDEIDLARQELATSLSGNVKFIEPPKGTDPAESMMLMANGAANVISNSTFSWWSAILNSAQLVVAPTKWFKDMKDPEDLIPPHWLKQESSWK